MLHVTSLPPIPAPPCRSLDNRRLPAATGIHRGTVPPRLGVPATAGEIQITNGSQQCLDLFAKIFLNAGDRVGMERPGTLGAIEAFSLYEPVFETVPLDSEGPDPGAFEKMLTRRPVKFFYGIPNSQNPSGCTYSQERRREIAEILDGTDTVFYEDDAFGELFFDGKPRLPLKRLLPGQAVISGSFSKITAPGMRIGWMYAPQEILTAFNTAKQAADLHSNFLCQQILHRYLTTHDLDAHIQKIVASTAGQCRLMCDLFDDLMPSLSHTTPEGGMFLTATLPAGLHAMKVFEEGVRAESSGAARDAVLCRWRRHRYDPAQLLQCRRGEDQRGHAPARRGYKKAFLKGGRAAVPDRFSLLAQSISFRKLFFHRAILVLHDAATNVSRPRPSRVCPAPCLRVHGACRSCTGTRRGRRGAGDHRYPGTCERDGICRWGTRPARDDDG